MIEGAVILSGVVRHWLDFFIILFLLFSNAVVAFWEEHQAGNELAALRAKLASKARALRDGKWATPKVAELVPGDVIRLLLGDIVPADARLLAGDPVQVDQSALTGESLPATRAPGEAVFSGSIIKRGETDAMVYATGTNTYFGKTAELVQDAHTVSHFQRAVLKIGNYLIVLAVALVAVIVTTVLFRHDPILGTLEFALVLLVAAIPVAMPTVLSVTMAVGAHLLAKKQAIVTKLSAIEELAGVDVLCSDKTGTLTQNKLTLGDPFCVNGIAANQIILDAALASRAEDKDTIDLAVIAGVKDDKALKSYQVLHFQPFDPVHKRTEATVKGSDGKQFKVAKGAPQVILQMATNVAEVKLTPEMLDKMNRYSRAADYLCIGQIYLFENPLLRERLKAEQIKPRLLGHWGTSPGQNLIYIHLNRLIKEHDANIIYIAGPGHGGPSLNACSYLEGTYTEVHPEITPDENGLRLLFRKFSTPGGVPSHCGPHVPNSMHERGELGYSMVHAFGAAFDNPDLIVACIVGDGESETCPLEGSWKSPCRRWITCAYRHRHAEVPSPLDPHLYESDKSQQLSLLQTFVS